MNDNELFELCKSVYEATGWNPGYWHTDYGVQRQSGTFENGRMKTVPVVTANIIAPAYTSDYLLSKIPNYISTYGDMGGDFVFRIQSCFNDKEWWAYYLGNGDKMQYHNTANTPLKALLKLTLELSKKGLLDAKDN